MYLVIILKLSSGLLKHTFFLFDNETKPQAQVIKLQTRFTSNAIIRFTEKLIYIELIESTSVYSLSTHFVDNLIDYTLVWQW